MLSTLWTAVSSGPEIQSVPLTSNTVLILTVLLTVGGSIIGPLLVNNRRTTRALETIIEIAEKYGTDHEKIIRLEVRDDNHEERLRALEANPTRVYQFGAQVTAKESSEKEGDS